MSLDPQQQNSTEAPSFARSCILFCHVRFLEFCHYLNFLKNLLYFANTSQTVELIISKCGVHHLGTLTTKSYKIIYDTPHSYAVNVQCVFGTHLQRRHHLSSPVFRYQPMSLLIILLLQTQFSSFIFTKSAQSFKILSSSIISMMLANFHLQLYFNA